MRPTDEFSAALVDPKAAQQRVLERILRRNEATAYGREHRFAECKDYDAFSTRVPVVGYTQLEPWIARITAGEPKVLIHDPVVYLATSSGTTGGKKYVPIHAGFAEETAGWMKLERRFLEEANPALAGTAELRYVNRVEGTLPSGIPFGSVSGWYYGEMEKSGRYHESVPYAVYQQSSVLARNYAVLRIALGGGFAQMSAVNPSTLLLLAQRLAADAESLVRDVHDGGVRHPELDQSLAGRLSSTLPADPTRAQALSKAIARDGTLTPRVAWPDLKLLSCWINAGAGLYQDDLKRVFGDVVIWDYGYTSSEGRVTVTCDAVGAGIPLLTTVFLELRGEDGSVRPLYSLSEGDQGEVIVTNSRGLYRYGMGDVVSIVGRRGATPLLRFHRKTSAVASLTGEKLTEDQVVRVVDQQLAQHGLSAAFFCLAPKWGTPPSYLLLLELKGQGTPTVQQLVKLRDEIESNLSAANPEYERKRETLRLGALELLLLEPGEFERYVSRLVRGGREAARVKIPRVTMDLELAKTFRGQTIPSSE